MLNKKPIILNCFARGGSSILVNFLISHPHVCISSGETHKVFKPGTTFDEGWPRIKKRFFYDYPIRFIAREDIFSAYSIKPRKNSVPDFLKRYIDRIFYHGRFTAMVESHNLYQYENVEYTKEELAKSRLLTKGLDGIVYTSDLLSEMYPDATFFALVRNGLALCEGRTRRGMAAEKFAHRYNAVVEKMLANSEKIPNYHMIKYEELVAKPLETMRRIYELADLDISQVKKVRLLSRPITSKDGERIILKGDYRQVVWYDFEEIPKFIKPDVNENQIRKLAAENKDKFLSIAGKTMEKLDYSTDVKLNEMAHEAG